jgi:nucleotide-binding universal stress UspA family protein
MVAAMSSSTTIVLATDLTPRSDRAMDRAALLMKEWNCRLVVVHVLERSPMTLLSEQELTARTRSELCEQLRDAGERVAIRIERGLPADQIRRVVQAEGGTLLVTGVARNEWFGNVDVGDTVQGVLRGIEIPLLAISARPRVPYTRITVAVDFTEVSRNALRMASALFPDRALTVFHAYHAPAGYAADNLQKYRETFHQPAYSDTRDLVKNTPLSDATRSRLEIQVQFGSPAQELAEWTESKQVELVVVGTSGRGRLGELLLGSVAKRVLAAVSCDVLLVPAKSS